MGTKKSKLSGKKRPIRRGRKSKGEPETVNFHYIKGPDFRSVHVDGAIGALTTKGFLHIALYAERGAIPRRTTHNILADRTLGDEIERDSREGIVRQMEVDIIVNEETARDLRNWLDLKLEDFEDRRRMLEELKSKRK